MNMGFSLITHQNITHCRTFWPFGNIFLGNVYVVFNSVSSSIGICSNLLLLAALFRSKQTQQNTMKVVFCLACSDFAISAFVIPIYLFINISGISNCTLENILMMMFVLFGINTANMLLMLSLDRVLLISWPTFYRKWIKPNIVKVFLILSWVVSLLYAISALFLSPIILSEILVIIALTYFSISLVSYIRVLQVVRSHRRKIRSSRASLPADDPKLCKSGRWKKGQLSKPKKRISFKLQVEVFEDTGYESPSGKLVEEINRQVAEHCTKKEHTEMGARGLLPMETQGEHSARYLQLPEKKNETISAIMPGIQNIGSTERQMVKEDAKVVQPFIIDTSSQNIAGAREGIDQSEDQKKTTAPYLLRFMPLKFNEKDENTNNRQRMFSSRSFKKEVNVTCSVAIVISTLFLCYIPFAWASFLWAGKEYKENIHASFQRRSIYAWTFALAFLHSSLSPIIMISRNKVLRRTIRDAARKLFACR